MSKSEPRRGSGPPARPHWPDIDTVLLDMDGTLLDLSFDEYFWKELLPRRYATRHGLSLDDASARLTPMIAARAGTLDWYCLDYWSARLELDVVAIKHEVATRIAILPGSREFLDGLARLGKRRVLATNAHPASVDLKLSVTGLATHFEAVHSAHDFGEPKEALAFWHALRGRERFDPARTLFVDDNLAVLDAARRFGLHTVAVRRPMADAAPRDTGDFPAVDGVLELLGRRP